MPLINHTPWQLMSSLRRDAERLLQTELTDSFVPAADIVEHDDRFVVMTDLPGIDASEVEITVDGDLLTIRGERVALPTGEDRVIRRAERPRGSFERSFRLPDTARNQGVEAQYRDGVLSISIPKTEDAVPYRIEVTAN